jgi:type IV secretory pathway TrbD component
MADGSLLSVVSLLHANRRGSLRERRFPARDRRACVRGSRAGGKGAAVVPGERGQATVELVAVLPFVVLAGLVAWQLALAGHAAWLVGHAARAAARADAVGEGVGAAARSALPRSHRPGLRVYRLRAGGVRVSVAIPLVVPWWPGPVRLTATSSLGRSR